MGDERERVNDLPWKERIPFNSIKIMKAFPLILIAACLAGGAACLPAAAAATVHGDTVATAWRGEIPLPVYPDAALVDLYEKTWEIAAGRVRKGPEGLPASPYLDENCYEDQIWIWDTCFMALFSKYAPQSFPGMESLDNFYAPMHREAPTPLRIHFRDNPPLFAWVEREYYRFSGDQKRLKRVVSQERLLQRHFQWFNSAVRGERVAYSPNPIHLGAVGSDGFTWTGRASGMDNTPRGRDAGGDDKILWVDAISQQALSARCIAELCRAAGDPEEAVAWESRYKELAAKINGLYWDEKDGCYYDVEVATGLPCRVKTIASFWPLLAGVASPAQAARMVEHVRDESGFGGSFPWPTLVRSDRDFNADSGDYWRGGIWLPTAYMATKALERYGYADLADELAEKVLRQQLRTYHAVTPHTIWECYHPGADLPSTEHGRRVRPEFCGWSALGPISLFIENVLGFHEISAERQCVRWRLRRERGKHGIRRLRFGNTVTDIVFDGEKSVSVKSNIPYALYVNGAVHAVPAGESVIFLPSK